MLSVVPSAWELTSPQKAVFPQVFKFIASSEGMAAATFPSLLPLLSKVPVEVMGDQEKFLDRWFSALQEGVGSVRGALELKAVLAAYLDCLFFVLNQEWLESGVEEHLVKNHLLMLFLRASAEPKMASAGVAQLMAPYLMAWDRQEKPKAAAGLFWHELSIEALARVDDNETRNAEALLGLLVSLQPPTGERPEHLKKLVEQLWHLLLLQLESTDRADAAARRLKVLHEATAESVLADPQKVVDQLLPLLPSPSHQASACALLWTITRLLPAPDLAAILSKVTDTIPKATQLLLNTVGKEAQNNAGVSLWLSSENMQAYVLLLLQSVTEPQREEDAFASLAALKTAGFQLIDSNTLWQQLVDTLTTFMPEDLTRACRLLDVVEASLDLWKGESAASLLLSLYKATPEDAGPELQLQKTWLKGVGGGLEAKVAALVRGQLAEEEEEQERLLAKCLLILDRLEEGSKDGFLLATMPAQEERVQFGGRSAELLCHRNFSTSAPSTSQLDSPQLGRPWGALFFCRLLLHRLGLALPVEEVNNSTASERSLEPIFLEQMGEVMLCIGYLTSLAGNSSCPAPVNPLLSSLSLAVSTLLSNLDKESCSQVQHLLRGNALREGGLWATGLAWLLDEIGTNVEPLMPRVDTWTDGELDTAAELLTLAVKQGKGEAMVMQCLGVETARIVSMGGFINPLAIGPTWLVSHCIEFSKEEFMAEEVRAVLDTLPAWRADNEDGLLFNCSLEATTWEQALPVATVAKLLTSAVNFCPSALSPALWDLASCSLVSWVASLEETGAFLTQSPAASLVAVAVARLGAALGTLLGPVGHHPALAPKPSIIYAGEEEALPPRLREEWAEFFSESVFSSILQTFVSLSSQPHTSTCATIQAELGAALVHCPAPVLMATPLSPLHMPQDVDSPPLPDSLTFFYNHLGPLLLSPSRNTQVSTAHLLAAVATDLIAAEGEGKDEEEERSLPLRLMEVVARGGAALEAVLQEWKVGEPAPTIPPGCAAHTAAMGFLLSWRVILTLISAAGQELRPRYSEFLRIRGHLDQLLDLLFRLLPSSPVPSPDYFCPELHPSAFPTSELEQLAGSCWVAVCRHLPALARHWWQEKDRQAAAAVEKLTCAVVTPLLWREETKAIEAAPASENMSLRVRDSVREVVATYSIDEGSMELVVSLPANHPLGGLTVESGKRVGVDTGQWRKWMLQLTTFLTHQNGTILDGLDLWRRNVDKRFEGVEVMRFKTTKVVFNQYFSGVLHLLLHLAWVKPPVAKARVSNLQEEIPLSLPLQVVLHIKQFLLPPLQEPFLSPAVKLNACKEDFPWCYLLEEVHKPVMCDDPSVNLPVMRYIYKARCSLMGALFQRRCISARMSGRERVVTFQGHHSYIVSIARLCKQNGLFTDVTLQCDDGKLLAHRIVLAAVSPFLRGVLIELPSGTQDFTIIVPDVRRAIVQQLLDFLYTGNMNVEQEATWELQELVHLLKIDPSNVGVVVDDDGCASRLASNGICETVGVKIATRAELPAGSRLPVSSPHPTPALPRLTIKTEHQQTPHHLTNGLHRPPPAKSPPSRPATRPKPLSSRPDYVESPPHSPVHHQAPHSLTKKLSSPGRGGSKAGAVSPASSRLVSHTGQTASTRGGHAATNGGRPAHSPGTRPNSNGPRGGSVKALTAKPRVARPEESGQS